MNDLWKPKSTTEKWIATILVWIICAIFSNIFGNTDFSAGFFGFIAIGSTIYFWMTKTKNEPKNGSVFCMSTMRYYGGGSISKEKNVLVSVTNKELSYDNESIPIENIKSVNLETQSQIKSRLTVTRMALFGVFALAAPKHKKNVDKYLAIEYDKGFSSTLVLGGKNTTKIQAALIKAKSKSINVNL